MAGQIEEEAFQKAVRYIEYRPRSAGETRTRLRRWGYGNDIVDTVLDRLTENGLINDGEFARVFTEELLRKGLGPFRVRAELKKKYIDAELIDSSLEEYTPEMEKERAQIAAARRFTNLSARMDIEEARSKIFGYLLRRGYSRESAVTACRSISQVDTQSGTELE